MNLLSHFLFAVEIGNFGAKCVMTSLDIEIFLTTISLDETSENLWTNSFLIRIQFTGLPKNDLKELLKFVAHISFFRFDNKYQCQLDYVAIGSPPEPSLDVGFLCYFGKLSLFDCSQDIQPYVR